MITQERLKAERISLSSCGYQPHARITTHIPAETSNRMPVRPSRQKAKRLRRQRNKLRRQRNKHRTTAFRTTDELQKFGARVYLLVEMDKKRYVYNSDLSGSWPPSREKIVSTLGHSLPSHSTQLANISGVLKQSEGYSLPVEYGPGSFTKDGNK